MLLRIQQLCLSKNCLPQFFFRGGCIKIVHSDTLVEPGISFIHQDYVRVIMV